MNLLRAHTKEAAATPGTASCLVGAIPSFGAEGATLAIKMGVTQAEDTSEAAVGTSVDYRHLLRHRLQSTSTQEFSLAIIAVV